MPHRRSILQPLLSKFERRFSVLDLGCGNALLSREIASKYDCVIVGVEKDYAITGDEPDNLIILKHEFTVDEIVRFSECEHFDVILALNFLHWFDGLEVAQAISNMGTCIIQIPNRGDTKACGQERLGTLHDWLDFRGAEYIGASAQFAGHDNRNIYVLRHDNTYRLHRAGMGGSYGSNDALIISDIHEKVVSMHERGVRPWVEGLNLWTFCGFGGVVPSKDKILSWLSSFPLPKEHHGDIVPWNFILDGRGLSLIDGFEGWEFDDRENLNKTITMVNDALSERRIGAEKV